jgi:hypothetical protein
MPSEALTNARHAVDAHLRAIPIDVVEHVTNYNGRDQRPGAYRGETCGHTDMRAWLKKLADLKLEAEMVERAFQRKVSMCEALGVNVNDVTDAQALEAVRTIVASAPTTLETVTPPADLRTKLGEVL